jgi:acetyl-CoA acyltransferase
MADNVWIIGTAMTKFGRYPDKDVVDLASDVALDAMADSQTTVHDMNVMAVGCQFEPFTLGQKIQKQIGQTGIPVYNVTNACATGASAVRTVIMAIKAGEADMGLAIGAEQMGNPGFIPNMGRARRDKFEPEGRVGAVMPIDGVLGTDFMAGVFAEAGMAYAAEHDGVGFDQFVKIAEKNHLHSSINPLAQYQKVFSVEEIKASPMQAYPNTLLMCCPTGDGAAAIVLVSEKKLKTLDPDVRKRAVKVSASVMTSDPWVEDGQVQPDVNTLTRLAADQAYEQSGVDPQDLDLVELHDCFATAELIHYDNLRLCEPGGAGAFIDSGGPMRDGTIPVNVSGGLISKGHPIGATGAANIYEVATHLRGEAGDRQIPDAKVGLTHVIGLGSACSVHILEKQAV